MLFDFDHIKVLRKYQTWENLFDSINESDYSPPGRMVKSNNKSHWVIYCKAIISIANFLSTYKTLEEFKTFVNGFLTNEQSKLALPLLLSEEIFGFGFPLACDFLKENVSPEFIKPDTHINDIAKGLGITNSTKNYHIFKDVESYCSRIGVLPYVVICHTLLETLTGFLSIKLNASYGVFPFRSFEFVDINTMQLNIMLCDHEYLVRHPFLC